MESLDRLSTMQMSGLNAERMTSFASSTVIISSDRAAGDSRKQSGAHESRRCKGANLQSPLLDRCQIAPSSYERRIDQRQSPKCHVETIRPFDTEFHRLSNTDAPIKSGTQHEGRIVPADS
jgi:hypothetical protein